MNRITFSRILDTQALSLFAVIAVASATMLAASPAEARDRQAAFSGAKGQTATRDVHRSQGDVASSTTGPRGQMSSRTVDRSAEGANATATGPQGNARTRDTDYQGGGNNTSTVTRANGETASRSVTRQP
jgi:hypothetical protein